MKIYFAAPLFSEAERKFNQSLAEKLESKNFEVFLPQRDGVEKEDSPYNAMTNEERQKAVFELDRDKIMEADIFLFVMDGRVPDEGACVELGLAYAHKNFEDNNKYIVGLHADIRAAFFDTKLNAMLKVPLDYIAQNESDLIVFLKNLK